MKNLFLLLITVLSCWLFQSCQDKTKVSVTSNEDQTETPATHMDTMGSHHENQSMMQSMKGKMAEMNMMKMTGDFDQDFANMMIMHHQSAIDMSEVVLTSGTDPQVKSMAQNIINTQKLEIVQMQEFAGKHKMNPAKMEHGEMHNELAEIMKKMETTMMSMQMSGNPDKDFLMMMIPHHESAVTMAESEIEHGKEFELKKLAQKIISDQNKEIEGFKAWISTH
ncbi:MAG: DUF305 domain-containing protein [Bacteroidota bacterium]|nr:DUF305 domain-containing protein [Bacteroidota bacterium]